MTRVSEHQHGVYPKAFTFRRRPVALVWSEYFSRFDEMVAFERQIKGWSRRKKEALIHGEWETLPALSIRGFRASADSHPSRRRFAAPQDEASGRALTLDHNEAHSSQSRSTKTTDPHPEEPALGRRLEG